MYENPFYEYGIPILLAVIFLGTSFGIYWVGGAGDDWREYREMRKKRKKRQKAAKARSQRAAA